MKYLSVVIGLLACAGFVSGCGGGSLGGGSRVLITREADGNQDIYLVSSTGATLQRLTTDAQVDEAPRWSPDGSQIAFIRRTAAMDSQTLYLMNSDGSSQQNLYPGLLAIADLPHAPTWLDNTTLVFRRGMGVPASLVKRTTNSSELTTLTVPGTDNFDELPAVSPNGATLAFIRNTVSGGAVTASTLYMVNADGTNVRSVIAGVARQTPAWSPDGTKLAFVHAKDGNQEIYIAAADGSNPQRLTNDPAADFAPVWSPDSSKLIFASARDGNNELYQINADGTGLLRLTNNTVSDIPYGWR